MRLGARGEDRPSPQVGEVSRHPEKIDQRRPGGGEGEIEELGALTEHYHPAANHGGVRELRVFERKDQTVAWDLYPADGVTERELRVANVDPEAVDVDGEGEPVRRTDRHLP